MRYVTASEGWQPIKRGNLSVFVLLRWRFVFGRDALTALPRGIDKLRPLSQERATLPALP